MYLVLHMVERCLEYQLDLLKLGEVGSGHHVDRDARTHGVSPHQDSFLSKLLSGDLKYQLTDLFWCEPTLHSEARCGSHALQLSRWCQWSQWSRQNPCSRKPGCCSLPSTTSCRDQPWNQPHFTSILIRLNSIEVKDTCEHIHVSGTPRAGRGWKASPGQGWQESCARKPAQGSQVSCR